MIIKFKKYNESFYNNTLQYYSFDIDDNLLYMPTEIIMEHLIDGEWVEQSVTTDEFSRVRNDKVHWRYLPGEESFSGFRDWGENGDNTFLIDFKRSVIDKNFGPSWGKFIECLVNGHIFSIVTSRGHHPKNIRKAIYWLIYEYGLDNFKDFKMRGVDKKMSLEDQMIENLLSYHQIFGEEPEQVIDQYIEMCPIYTCSSPYFIKKFGVLPSVDVCKKVALEDFTKMVDKYAKKIGATAKLGFSDDDPKFVKSAIDIFSEIMSRYKGVKFSVFDTGGKGMTKRM